ncbi:MULTISPECIES: signal peptidase II [unclassified Streptomyces]|uniref:signal peptidase II n=1 Tax=unclassified Streptomyces TaxID=2593676 RepID=UPI002F9099A0|nr:signal peptidase II [Streptomyces sp. NBC_01108]
MLGALLGGAASHLGDRLFREPGLARGRVVDFIDYGAFVGNVADIALACGCVALVLLSLRGVQLAKVPGEESAQLLAKTTGRPHQSKRGSAS